MKCQIEIVDHSGCPADENGKHMACYADPCAVTAEHQKTAKFRRCENERLPGEMYCEACLRTFTKARAEQQKAQEDQAIQAAKEAIDGEAQQ